MQASGFTGGGFVEVRAFRGSRKTSVYHELVLPEGAFARIVETAGGAGLALLPSLDRHGTRELGKHEAGELAREATSLRVSAALPDLDDQLTALAELARWCARASGASRLTIEAAAPEP